MRLPAGTAVIDSVFSICQAIMRLELTHTVLYNFSSVAATGGVHPLGPSINP